MPTALITAFTPFAKRKELRHGQGVITYGESNELHIEQVFPQAAPDPIRQGDTPSRAPRRQVAIMSTRPHDWGYGISEDFIPNAESHLLLRRIMQAGRQTNVRSQNDVGVRPNIERPPAVTYGSLFQLTGPTYDVFGGY